MDEDFALAMGGAAEIDELQGKLTRQMSYCTQLSKHAHDLEQRASLHATEIREKTSTLRSALETLDTLRAEKQELRARLHKAENAVAMVSTEVRVHLLIVAWGSRGGGAGGGGHGLQPWQNFYPKLISKTPIQNSYPKLISKTRPHPSLVNCIPTHPPTHSSPPRHHAQTPTP